MYSSPLSEGKSVKEASAVFRSFLAGVFIFFFKYLSLQKYLKIDSVVRTYLWMPCFKFDKPHPCRLLILGISGKNHGLIFYTVSQILKKITTPSRKLRHTPFCRLRYFKNNVKLNLTADFQCISLNYNLNFDMILAFFNKTILYIDDKQLNKAKMNLMKK